MEDRNKIQESSENLAIPNPPNSPHYKNNLQTRLYIKKNQDFESITNHSPFKNDMI